MSNNEKQPCEVCNVKTVEDCISCSSHYKERLALFLKTGKDEKTILCLRCIRPTRPNCRGCEFEHKPADLPKLSARECSPCVLIGATDCKHYKYSEHYKKHKVENKIAYKKETVHWAKLAAGTLFDAIPSDSGHSEVWIKTPTGAVRLEDGFFISTAAAKTRLPDIAVLEKGKTVTLTVQ